MNFPKRPCLITMALPQVGQVSSVISWQASRVPQVLGVLAVRIAGAREELPEAAPLLEHGLAALGARLARLLPDLVVRHAAFRLADVPVELLVELAHQVDPVGVAFLDLVERLLELGGE